MPNTLVGRGGGKGGWNVTWYYDTLTPGLAKFAAKMELGIRETMEEMAQEIEDYMRANAPWDDQTGDARDGLTADPHQDGRKFFIEIFHTVDYGIWLEIRWGGRYAIIIPTLENMGPQVMVRLQEVFAII